MPIAAVMDVAEGGDCPLRSDRAYTRISPRTDPITIAAIRVPSRVEAKPEPEAVHVALRADFRSYRGAAEETQTALVRI